MTAQQDFNLQTASQQREQLHGRISTHIMEILGRPVDLQQVQVRHLWGACYRVNVLVGAAAASVRVAKSYFLTIDENGRILTAIPELIREFWQEGNA